MLVWERVLPLLNGIRVINQLFTKQERTSLSCFVSNTRSLLPVLSIESLSPALIPNKCAGPEVLWG